VTVLVADGTVVVELLAGGGLAPEVVLEGGTEDGDVSEEPLVAEAPGSEPGSRRAGFVWKLNTATTPATVATITIGARLMVTTG
jgi:hypothetical protein